MKFKKINLTVRPHKMQPKESSESQQSLGKEAKLKKMWFLKDRKPSSSQAWFNWALRARQDWNAVRCNCRWTKLQIRGGNKMIKTITWEVFGRRNERISGRRINVSSWQRMKSSCVHLWINSLHLASVAKGRRIEKISPKQRGNLSSQWNTAAIESWNLPWALASDFSRAQGHRGVREEEKKLLLMWVQGEKWPQARGQSCQNPQTATWRIYFLIFNLLHLTPFMALKQLYLYKHF